MVEKVELFFRADEMRPTRFVFVITATVMLISMVAGIGMSWRSLPADIRPAVDQKLFIYSKQISGISTLAWSPDGRRIASGGQDVRIWDATTGTNPLVLEAKATNVLAWSPDGHYLVMGNNTLTTWDTRTGQKSRSYIADAQRKMPGGQLLVSALAWSPDRSMIAAASAYTHIPKQKANESVYAVDVWRAVDGQALFSYRGQKELITMVRWSPDSKRLASSDGAIQVWDAVTGKHVVSYSRGADYSSMDWSSNGRWLAAIGVQSIDIWDASSGTLMRSIQNIGNDVCVRWSPDGMRVASGLHGIHVWNALTGKMLLRHGQGMVQTLGWSPDGKMIASGEARDRGMQKGQQVEVWAVPAVW